MSDGNTAIFGGTVTRRNTGYNFVVNIIFDKRDDLFTSATENKRIAAFQTYNVSETAVFNKGFVDFLLYHVMIACDFSGINQFTVVFCIAQ